MRSLRVLYATNKIRMRNGRGISLWIGSLSNSLRQAKTGHFLKQDQYAVDPARSEKKHLLSPLQILNRRHPKPKIFISNNMLGRKQTRFGFSNPEDHSDPVM